MSPWPLFLAANTTVEQVMEDHCDGKPAFSQDLFFFSDLSIVDHVPWSEHLIKDNPSPPKISILLQEFYLF